MSGSVGYIGDPEFYYFSNSSSGSSGVNSIYLTKYQTGEQALSSIAKGGIGVLSYNGTWKMKMVVYADSAGVPGALLQTSNEVQGPVGSFWATFSFATPFALSANTPYWLGYITDSAMNVFTITGTSTATPAGSVGPRLGYTPGSSGTPTYASGPPGTLAGVTPAFGSADVSCIPCWLQGTYSEYLAGHPEWTPAPVFSAASVSANQTYVTTFLSQDALTAVTTAHLMFSTAAAGAKAKALVYADNAGVPGTLLATSDEKVGITVGYNSFNFSSTFNIAQLTRYWLGFITDTLLKPQASYVTTLPASLVFGVPPGTSGPPGTYPGRLGNTTYGSGAVAGSLLTTNSNYSAVGYLDGGTAAAVTEEVVSKANIYATMDAVVAGNVSKAQLYAALDAVKAVNVSKANVYAVLGPFVATTQHRPVVQVCG